jgi:uncharacterized protein YaiI (UPF0178 family)
MRLFIDGDGCPVKEESYRVAQRHGMQVIVVANKRMNIPLHPLIRMEVVAADPDAADNWIAENIAPDDICVTADIPLADRCLKAHAKALDPRGEEWTEDNIGDAIATREIMRGLREMGETRGGPAPMSPRDRSQFLGELEQLIQRVKRRPYQE